MASNVMSQRIVGLRTNFAWNFLGESVYSLVQWMLVVVVAQLGSPALVGQFALALAIAAPVFLLVGLNLRVVQATDSARVWSLTDYLRVRHLLNGACLVACLGVGLLAGLEPAMLAVLAVVAATKIAEALSQTYYGHLQRCERLDIVSWSLMLRSLLGATLFSAAFAVSGQLAAAIVGQCLAWTAVALLFDRRAAWSVGETQRGAEAVPLARLVRRALPLGVDAGASSLIVNVPRYVLASTLGAAQLGVYASLAYLAQTVSMITGSLANAVISRLALYHEGGQRREFTQLLARLTGFGVVVALVGALAAAVLGEAFLRLVLGSAYADRELLVVLMLSAGMATVQRCLGRGLQAAHVFGRYLATDIICLASVAVSAPFLVPAFGVVGAAWSLVVGFTFTIAIELAVLRRVLVKMSS